MEDLTWSSIAMSYATTNQGLQYNHSRHEVIGCCKKLPNDIWWWLRLILVLSENQMHVLNNSTTLEWLLHDWSHIFFFLVCLLFCEWKCLSYMRSENKQLSQHKDTHNICNASGNLKSPFCFLFTREVFSGVGGGWLCPNFHLHHWKITGAFKRIEFHSVLWEYYSCLW